MKISNLLLTLAVTLTYVPLAQAKLHSGDPTATVKIVYPEHSHFSNPELDPTKFHLTLPKQRNQFLQALESLVVNRFTGMVEEKDEYFEGKLEDEIAADADFLNPLFIHYRMGTKNAVPEAGDGMAFVNSTYEFKGISNKKIGYCYAMATLMRNLHFLAFYTPNIEASDNVPEPHTKQWIKYYAKKIKNIRKGIPTVFPGFSSAFELSMVPEFELELKINVMKLWKDLAYSNGSIKAHKGSHLPMNEERIDTLLTDLGTKLKRGELPKVLITSAISKTILGGGRRTHVLIVYDLKTFENGEADIKIWDGNFYGPDQVKRDPTIRIRRENGVLVVRYPSWSNPFAETKEEFMETELPGDRLGEVTITPENSRETLKMVQQLKKFCSKKQAHAEIEKACKEN